jgi:stage II sporulation protein R
MKKICVLSGILFAMLVTGMIVKGKRMDMQQCLAKEVFRFHVLANSDSREDQELKLQVKEAVIAYTEDHRPKGGGYVQYKDCRYRASPQEIRCESLRALQR